MQTIINLDVPELEPAVAFYQAALGLTHRRTLDNDVAELSGASCRLYLLVGPAGSKPLNTLPVCRHYSRHWCPVHIDFVVDDILAARKRALAAGAVEESPCISWKGSKCITFSDPFGHGFCLIEFSKDSDGIYQDDE